MRNPIWIELPCTVQSVGEKEATNYGSRAARCQEADSRRAQSVCWRRYQDLLYKTGFVSIDHGSGHEALGRSVYTLYTPDWVSYRVFGGAFVGRSWEVCESATQAPHTTARTTNEVPAILIRYWAASDIVSVSGNV